MHGLPRAAASKGGRLLCILLLRIDPLSADPVERQGCFVLSLRSKRICSLPRDLPTVAPGRETGKVLEGIFLLDASRLERIALC
jgi:hypothetical protein